MVESKPSDTMLWRLHAHSKKYRSIRYSKNFEIGNDNFWNVSIVVSIKWCVVSIKGKTMKIVRDEDTRMYSHYQEFCIW